MYTYYVIVDLTCHCCTNMCSVSVISSLFKCCENLLPVVVKTFLWCCDLEQPIINPELSFDELPRSEYVQGLLPFSSPLIKCPD